MFKFTRDYNGDMENKSHLRRFRYIHAYSGKFRHIQTYSIIFRNYSDTFRTLCNPGIFRTPVHSEPWHIQSRRHIQNTGIFRTVACSEPATYLEPWYIQNPCVFRTRDKSRILPNICDRVFCENS